MGNERRGAKVTNRSVPRQDHRIETEMYFAKGLESSATTVSEDDRMPTVQNLSEVQRKCGVKGRTELHERESTMNRNKNPVEEGVEPRGRGGDVASLPWAEAIKGEETGWWWNPTMISLVLRFQSPEV